MPPPNKYSCVSCSRRKVKCDRLVPCSGCSRTETACVYRAPPPSQRHRRRHTHGDLLFKIQELEALLGSKKIPFEPLSGDWISSSLEDKFVKSSQAEAQAGSSSSDTPTIAGEETVLERENQGSIRDNEILPGQQSEAARLWSGLSEDLRKPAVPQLKRFGKDEDEVLSRGAAFHDSSLFMPNPLTIGPGQLELHPDPKHVFKLWQSFAENVNPLTKIIHAPTLQVKLFDAAWNAESAPKPLEATMFAVYALAVTSIKAADCTHIFGQSKSVLLNRFRTGALRALSATNIILTRDLEVLQALALILMIDHQSELSITAVALALRIAHKMGLHRAGEVSQAPFFEQEMKVRLWWYIRGLNSRVRRAMGLASTIDDLGDIRLPINVNDADLHPGVVHPPAVRHTAATEMVYVLMKHDLWTFVRTSSNFSGSRDPREKASQLTTSTSSGGLEKKRKVLGEVELMLKEKYLDHLDPGIPLQRLAIGLASITIHRQRFMMFHPRHQPEGGKYMSREDQDAVFESSVRLLELDRDVRNSNFSTDLVDGMTCRTQVEALVYMVSELRRRTSGPLVGTAWKLLEELHDEQPALMQGSHVFCTALAGLTLEAWEIRWAALQRRAEDVPRFIEMLQVTREDRGGGNGTPADIGELPSGFMDDLMHDEALNWNNWNDLLSL